MRRISSPSADEASAKTPSRPRLLYLIKRSYAAAKIVLDDMTRAHGLTTSDYTILSFLRRLEPCSAADLARAQKVTPQAVTQQVVPLLAKGLVTRRESDENRRIALLSMTPRGHVCLAEISAQARQIETEMLAGLSAEDREVVLDFLIRSTAILENRGPS